MTEDLALRRSKAARVRGGAAPGTTCPAGPQSQGARGTITADRVSCEPGLLMEAMRQSLVAYPLTRREAEVVWLLAGGLSNKEIAARCGVSLQTVKDHLKHVYAKVGAHQRTALLARLLGTSL